MTIIRTRFPEVLVIEPKAFKDKRGWFIESYNRRQLSSLGIHVEFVQDNHSYSRSKGTIRGLHFQKEPGAQSKLVRCVRGAIRDVVVDIRNGSPTQGKWESFQLSSKNMKQVFIPKGFAHGFLTLEDRTEVEYKVDSYYDKALERCIRYDDPDLGIDWQVASHILSEKDVTALRLRDVDINLEFERKVR